MGLCPSCTSLLEPGALRCAKCGAQVNPDSVLQVSSQPQKSVAATPAKIALWNPNAAASWSILLSPAFGAFLHWKNAIALGRTDEAKANKVWFQGTLAFFAVVLASVALPSISDGFLRGAGIGILVGWYFSLGKKQGQYVQETLRGDYARRPWGKALLIAFACYLAFMIAIVIVAAVAGVEPA